MIWRSSCRICFIIICLQLIWTISAQKLCEDWKNTIYTQINIQMDGFSQKGTGEMCSCQITMEEDGTVSMFANSIRTQGCGTSISLTPSRYSFNCVNNKIAENQPYSNNHQRGDSLWLIVSSNTDATQTLSGILQIKMQSGGSATIECYGPNRNSSLSTTTLPPMQMTTQSSTPTPMTSTTTISTTGSTSSTSTQGPINTSNLNRDTTVLQSSTSNSTPTSTSNHGQSSGPDVTTSSPGNTGSIPTVSKGPPAGSKDPNQSSVTYAGEATSTVGTTDKVSKSDKEADFPVAAVAGGVAGGLVLILILIIVFTCYRRKKKEKHQPTEGNQIYTRNGHSYVNHTYEDDDIATVNREYQPANFNMEIPTNESNQGRNEEKETKPSQNDEHVHDVNTSHQISPSGDIYAVVKKTNDKEQLTASGSSAEHSGEAPQCSTVSTDTGNTTPIIAEGGDSYVTKQNNTATTNDIDSTGTTTTGDIINKPVETVRFQENHEDSVSWDSDASWGEFPLPGENDVDLDFQDENQSGLAEITSNDQPSPGAGGDDITNWPKPSDIHDVISTHL